MGLEWTSDYHKMQEKKTISMETLLNEYEDIVKQIPECIMQAARGNITMEKKDDNIASKIYY